MKKAKKASVANLREQNISERLKIYSFFLYIPDNSLIGIKVPVRNVFHANVGRYQLNYFEAERLCEMLGATMASFEQLTAAWEAGLQMCR